MVKANADAPAKKKKPNRTAERNKKLRLQNRSRTKKLREQIVQLRGKLSSAESELGRLMST